MTDFLTDMDALQAEHEATKLVAEAKAAAIAEADEELRLAEYRKTARQARIASRVPYLKAIAAAIMGVGVGYKTTHTATIDETDGRLLVDGIDVAFGIELKSEYTRVSSWRSKPTGKLRITTRVHGNTISYPQRKDGTHNYDAIARDMIAYAERQNAEIKRRNVERLNANAAATVVQELLPNATYQDVISASSNPAKAIRFTIKIDQTMTTTDAIKLAAAIRAAGIKLHYSDN